MRPIHPDDVVWAVLVAERDGLAGRRTPPIADTPSARALMDELEELPLAVFLERLRDDHEGGDDVR